MTTEWLKERTNALLHELDNNGADFLSETNAEEPISAALQEAIERGRRNAISPMTAPDGEIVRIISEAEITKLRSILAHLRNPDEAMVEAVGDAIWPDDGYDTTWKRRVHNAIRALAAHLDEKDSSC